jgi:SAM-dependent methyltransferase
MKKERNEESWDRLAEHYQNSRRISLTNYHYNAYGPGDDELGIIGDVRDLDVLEVGCGGGQNSIVLAKKGARSVTGIDRSGKQLEHARNLAQREKVDVRFIKSDMEDMTVLENASFDLIASTHAMNYSFDLDAVFRECAKLLRPKGRLVICLNHPLWIVLGEALEQDDFTKIVDYYEGFEDIWDWENHDGKKIATFESTSWRLEQIINGLIKAGFSIERVAEPRGYSLEELSSLPPDAAPYVDIPRVHEAFVQANRVIPSGLIVASRKNLQSIANGVTPNRPSS